MTDDILGHRRRQGRPCAPNPFRWSFPGARQMDEEEIEAVARVLRSKSPFRYYGLDLQRETEPFEAEFAAFIGARHALAVAAAPARCTWRFRRWAWGRGRK